VDRRDRKGLRAAAQAETQFMLQVVGIRAEIPVRLNRSSMTSLALGNSVKQENIESPSFSTRSFLL